MADPSSLSKVTDTIFAMIATYLAGNGSRDIAGFFPTIPKETKSGHRQFTTPDGTFFICKRARGDYYIPNGINVYFGDSVAISRKVLPQIWRLPVMMHVICATDNSPMVSEKVAFRLGELLQNAWDGIGGTVQVYDFITSPPTPVIGRFVTWARSTRGSWQEVGDPTTDDFTNRIWNMEVRYSR